MRLQGWCERLPLESWRIVARQDERQNEQHHTELVAMGIHFLRVWMEQLRLSPNIKTRLRHYLTTPVTAPTGFKPNTFVWYGHSNNSTTTPETTSIAAITANRPPGKSTSCSSLWLYCHGWVGWAPFLSRLRIPNPKTRTNITKNHTAQLGRSNSLHYSTPPLERSDQQTSNIHMAPSLLFSLCTCVRWFALLVLWIYILCRTTCTFLFCCPFGVQEEFMILVHGGNSTSSNESHNTNNKTPIQQNNKRATQHTQQQHQQHQQH